MGLFCVNFHFRTSDDKALSAALERRGVTKYRVLPPKGGWTSLYEERASEQDDARVRELAGGLSQDLQTTAIAFLVHDSDIACYWLYDKGELEDAYNSCPDYFDMDDAGDTGPSAAGGRPAVLLRYCRPEVGREELEAIFAETAVFADTVIESFAEALGISRARVLADYRDIAGGGPGDVGDFEDDDDDMPDGGASRAPLLGLSARFAQMMGMDPRSVAADPQATALVEAAAGDNAAEVDRLLDGGVAVDAEAPAPLPAGQSMAGLGQLFPGKVPKVVMTPLLAAVANKRSAAAERLLLRGADPNRVHPLFGTAVHVASGGGDPDLLELLIRHGGDVNARNAQGQTPLQALNASRATLGRLTEMQTMIRAMGVAVPKLAEQLSDVTLPTEGWKACERLLRSHRAR